MKGNCVTPARPIDVSRRPVALRSMPVTTLAAVGVTGWSPGSVRNMNRTLHFEQGEKKSMSYCRKHIESAWTFFRN